MNSHLVAVEVGVEGRADERMELHCLAFDQLRLKSLNAESVKRRRAVEHDRVLENHFFEDVPDHGFLVLNHLLRSLRRRCKTTQNELIEDEGLEELERHQLRHAALVQTQFRAHRNHGTAGVVDALTEKVLTEAAGLALDHVGERLERTLVGAGHRLAAAAVVEKRVHSFLKHALFVAHDDVWSLDFKEALQAVVAVDDAAIEIIEVRSRKAAAVKRDERTEIRREHRQDRHDHPFGLDARTLEAFKDLESLGELLDLCFRSRIGELIAKTSNFCIDINRAQEFANRFSAHHGLEVVAELSRLLDEFLFVEKLAALKRRKARINNDVGFEVKHALDVAKRNIEHHAHTRRQALEEPDVRHRAREVNVTHAFTAHLGERHFNAALFADDAAILEALVLAAKAFVVLHRPEDLRAEKTVALRLLSAVVDRLRLFDFAVGPGVDLFRAGKTDADGIEMLVLVDLVENVIKRRIHFA